MIRHRFFVFLSIFIFCSCSVNSGPDKTITGAVLGAGWGLGTGAIVGNQVNSMGGGALVGAGVGAVSGALTGMTIDTLEESEIEQQREVNALRVQTACNQRKLVSLQESFDKWEESLASTINGTRVFFDKDMASLRLGAAADLEGLADFIRKTPSFRKIEIHGHAADFSEADENYRLSLARAKTVKTFLGFHGVPLDSIEVLAHGGKKPLTENETESGKIYNRRVEVVIVR